MSSALSNFTAVLGGGGWFNEDSAPLVERGFELCGTTVRMLVMPTPLSSPPCDELKGIVELFGARVELRTLTQDTQEMPDPVKAAEDIDWATLILVLGGNFVECMKRWRDTGIGKMMFDASRTASKTFVGASSGLNCWCRKAQTADRPLAAGSNSERYHLEPGLDRLPVIGCSHLDNFHSKTRVPRSVAFRSAIRRQPVGTVGVGLTNFAYIEIVGGMVTAKRTHRYAGVHRLESTVPGIDVRVLGPGDTMSCQEFFGA